MPFLDYDAANRAPQTHVVPASACRCPLCRALEEGSLCGLLVVQNMVRAPVVRIARCGQSDSRCVRFRSRHVVQGVILCWAWFRLRPVVHVWYGVGVVGAWAGNPNDGDRVAEPAAVADAAARPRDRAFFED